MADLLISHTGDSHIDDRSYTKGDSAFRSHLRALDSFVRSSIESEVAVALHSGDATAHGRPSQETVLAFRDAMMPLMEAGIPLVLTEGNHEKYQVKAGQRTVTQTIGGLLEPYGEVHVVDTRPELIRTSTDVQIVVVPWLSKTVVLEEKGLSSVPPGEADAIVANYGMERIEALLAECDTSAPLIMTGHLTLDKLLNTRGSEVDAMNLFDEPVWNSEELDELPFAYVGLSHIHNKHRIGDSLYYAGSPDRFTFTDAGVPKSFNMVFLRDDGSRRKVRAVATDARLMADLRMDDPDLDDKIAALSPDEIVRLTLLPGERKPDADVAKAIEDRGAWLAKTPKTPMERVELEPGEAVAEDESVTSAMLTWLKLKHPELDSDTVLEKAQELLGVETE